MEHDIRNLFNINQFEKKKLPDFHKAEFTKRLENASAKKNKNTFFSKTKIAVFFLLMIFGVSIYFTFSEEEEQIKESLIFVEIEKIEKEYVANIDIEWQKFIKITNDTILINKYQQKLQNSNKDYKKLTLTFKESPNNIMVLETLIHNLQKRLQLLKDIQEHINELNQKNATNETIYL